ncbi:MAG: endolytic transglycosylase MltG [Rikenellaceae bacterium]
MKLFLRTFVILAVVGVVVTTLLYIQFYGNAVRGEVVIRLGARELAEGEAARLIDSLVKPNIRHKFAFDTYASRLNLLDRVKPGNYELKKGMDVVDIVRMLKLGEQSSVKLVFNYARGVEFLAATISKQIDADSLSLVEAMRSDSLATEFGLSSAQLVSLFIPNTYSVWWTISPEELVRRMNVESNRFWNESRESARKAMKLSRVEVMTLASIVFEETRKVDEMPRIAGVYLNRLRKRMKLQADPTVKFALGDFTIRRVLYKHLEYDSPYNTYKYRGLPPSPIATPSIAAIDSVLGAEKHNYIYFCARPEMDGYHNFAATYTQHKINARAFAAELNKRGVK